MANLPDGYAVGHFNGYEEGVASRNDEVRELEDKIDDLELEVERSTDVLLKIHELIANIPL